MSRIGKKPVAILLVSHLQDLDSMTQFGPHSIIQQCQFLEKKKDF